MKREILILILVIASCPLRSEAQNILTLKECYQLAMSANAIAGEKTAHTDISQLKDNNLSKGWLPTLDANGSFLYNSSVIDMSSILGPLPVAGLADAINPLPHEQYKLTLEINQLIYDGGAIKGAKAMENAELQVNKKQTETDLYKLRAQVNICYFSIMLINKQKQLLYNFLELLGERISSMESALENGVILKSDIDILTSEKIKIEQQLFENEIKKSSFLKILSDLTGKYFDSSTEFIIPLHESLSGELFRPELQLFDLKKEQLSAGIVLIESKRLPKAFGFASLGYGNPPGSNFFKDEFAPYYVLGAGIRWNIYDWNKSKNDKKVITIQQGIIEGRKKDLTDNLKRQLESKKAEIESLETIIKMDTEQISIRKRITASSDSQYKNGTITATEYLNVLNSEKQALINSEIHKINIAMARVEYLNISGKELE